VPGYLFLSKKIDVSLQNLVENDRTHRRSPYPLRSVKGDRGSILQTELEKIGLMAIEKHSKRLVKRRINQSNRLSKLMAIETPFRKPRKSPASCAS